MYDDKQTTLNVFSSNHSSHTDGTDTMRTQRTQAALAVTPRTLAQTIAPAAFRVAVLVSRKLKDLDRDVDGNQQAIRRRHDGLGEAHERRKVAMIKHDPIVLDGASVSDAYTSIHAMTTQGVVCAREHPFRAKIQTHFEKTQTACTHGLDAFLRFCRCRHSARSQAPEHQARTE